MTIYAGDVREVLPTLPDESVHCVVTSPPYWGLEYGIPPSIWPTQRSQGVVRCNNGDHLWRDASWKPERWGAHDDDNPGAKQQTNAGSLGHRGNVKEAAECELCGTWLGAFGLEPTPELYVAHAVQIFREVRRILRDDGTLWLNMGDSYNSGTSADRSAAGMDASDVGYWMRAGRMGDKRVNAPGLKTKDLCGIPWMLAFALRADGWYLRSDIIWAKPNPMPESVTDRPTKSHEYIFLLTKSERYYYDAEAIREPHQDANVVNGVYQGKGGVNSEEWVPETQGWNGTGLKMNSREYNPAGRNKRSVWTVATQPFPEAHFATFPEDLIKPCILAGCSDKCCAKCGAPWKRVHGGNWPS